MSEDRLTLSQLALLTAYAVGMSGGQILFKMASLRFVTAGGSSVDRLLALLQNVYFLAALVLYGGFSVLWVWILSFTPLSRAYPFVALAFAFTPLLGGLLFNEAISSRLVTGILFILLGLFLVVG
jgi:drug/metabolite transporter (DMT)-like permease